MEPHEIEQGNHNRQESQNVQHFSSRGDMAALGGNINKDNAVQIIESVNSQYEPKPWERIIALVAAILWIGLVGFLVIRNQPLEPNLIVLVRIILSVMAGIVGAVIPGFLSIDIRGAGFVIRAAGAFALFTISYFFTPRVL